MGIVRSMMSSFRVGFRSGCEQGRGKVPTKSERTARLTDMITKTRKFDDHDVKEEYFTYVKDFHPTEDEHSKILRLFSKNRPKALLSMRDEVANRRPA